MSEDRWDDLRVDVARWRDHDEGFPFSCEDVAALLAERDAAVTRADAAEAALAEVRRLAHRRGVSEAQRISDVRAALSGEQETRP